MAKLAVYLQAPDGWYETPAVFLDPVAGRVTPENFLEITFHARFDPQELHPPIDFITRGDTEHECFENATFYVQQLTSHL